MRPRAESSIDASVGDSSRHVSTRSSGARVRTSAANASRSAPWGRRRMISCAPTGNTKNRRNASSVMKTPARSTPSLTPWSTPRTVYRSFAMLPSEAWLSRISSSPGSTTSVRASWAPTTTPYGSAGSSQAPSRMRSSMRLTRASRATSMPWICTPADASAAAPSPKPRRRADAG